MLLFRKVTAKGEHPESGSAVKLLVTFIGSSTLMVVCCVEVSVTTPQGPVFVATNITLKVPESVYVCVALIVFMVLLSPKFH